MKGFRVFSGHHYVNSYFKISMVLHSSLNFNHIIDYNNINLTMRIVSKL